VRWATPFQPETIVSFFTIDLKQISPRPRGLWRCPVVRRLPDRTLQPQRCGSPDPPSRPPHQASAVWAVLTGLHQLGVEQVARSRFAAGRYVLAAAGRAF